MISQQGSRLSIAARLLIAVTVTLAAALALQVAHAQAVPATQTWAGQADGSTPDINRGDLVVFDRDGEVVAASAMVGTLNFLLDGAHHVGYCTDASRWFSTDAERVDVKVEHPAGTPAGRALAWILVNHTPRGEPTAEKRTRAAVAQVAALLLVDEDISQEAPTSDPAVNASAAALVREALAATASPAALAVSAAPPPPGATSATLRLSGTPGAAVSLAITAGAGQLSAAQVTLGPDGGATVTLTAPWPGTVTVRATTAGDPRLIRITPVDAVQPTAAAEATLLTADVSVAFTAAPAPAVVPSPPPAPVAGRPAVVPGRLAIAKSGPARARVLQRVRYRISVRNPGRVATRGVVLHDRLPRGLSFVRASRRGSFRHGSLVFRLGTLRPGQRRVVSVWLMASAGVRGRRVNVATARAPGVRPVRARAVTVFRPRAQRVQPAVTG